MDTQAESESKRVIVQRRSRQNSERAEREGGVGGYQHNNRHTQTQRQSPCVTQMQEKCTDRKCTYSREPSASV